MKSNRRSFLSAIFVALFAHKLKPQPPVDIPANPVAPAYEFGWVGFHGGSGANVVINPIRIDLLRTGTGTLSATSISADRTA